MRVGSTAVAVCALVASAFAHESDSVSGGSQAPQGRITAIGCLKTADASLTAGATSTTGTAGTPTSNANTTKAAEFMLTNASIASTPATWPRGGVSGGGASSPTGAASGAAAGTSTPAGPSRGPGATTPSVYVLDGSSDALQAHVNRQVQITGQVEAPASPPAKSGTGRASGSQRAGAPASAAPSMNESGHATQRLRVESVRVIAEACSMR
jgi:hypothetical protein